MPRKKNKLSNKIKSLFSSISCDSKTFQECSVVQGKLGNYYMSASSYEQNILDVAAEFYHQNKVSFIDIKYAPYTSASGKNYNTNTIVLGQYTSSGGGRNPEVKTLGHKKMTDRMIGTLMHELSHFAFDLIFDNQSKPFSSNQKGKKEFVEAIKVIRKGAKKYSNTWSSSYDLKGLGYDQSEYHAEFAVKHIENLAAQNINEKNEYFDSIFEWHNKYFVSEAMRKGFLFENVSSNKSSSRSQKDKVLSFFERNGFNAKMPYDIVKCIRKMNGLKIVRLINKLGVDIIKPLSKEFDFTDFNTILLKKVISHHGVPAIVAFFEIGVNLNKLHYKFIRSLMNKGSFGVDELDISSAKKLIELFHLNIVKDLFGLGFDFENFDSFDLEEIINICGIDVIEILVKGRADFSKFGTSDVNSLIEFFGLDIIKPLYEAGVDFSNLLVYLAGLYDTNSVVNILMEVGFDFGSISAFDLEDLSQIADLDVMKKLSEAGVNFSDFSNKFVSSLFDRDILSIDKFDILNLDDLIQIGGVSIIKHLYEAGVDFSNLLVYLAGSYDTNSVINILMEVGFDFDSISAFDLNELVQYCGQKVIEPLCKAGANFARLDEYTLENLNEELGVDVEGILFGLINNHSEYSCF